MKEELKNTLKYLKNKNNTRRIKTITINEAHKVVEEIERLNNIINELEHDFESYELEYLQDTYQGSLADFIETELERINELKGDDSNGR